MSMLSFLFEGFSVFPVNSELANMVTSLIIFKSRLVTKLPNSSNIFNDEIQNIRSLE